jgi:hypothetical protein
MASGWRAVSRVPLTRIARTMRDTIAGLEPSHGHEITHPSVSKTQGEGRRSPLADEEHARATRPFAAQGDGSSRRDRRETARRIVRALCEGMSFRRQWAYTYRTAGSAPFASLIRAASLMTEHSRTSGRMAR